MLVADVIMPVPLQGLFTYRVPENLADIVAPGKRAVVPFGPRRLVAGIIRTLRNEAGDQPAWKEISSITDEIPVVSEVYLKFWDWLSSYYLCTPGEVMMAALPSAFRLESETRVMLHPDFDGDHSALSDKEYLIVEALQYTDSLTMGEMSDITGSSRVMNLVHGLMAKNVIVSSESIENTYREKTVSVVRLAGAFQNEEELKKVMDALSARAYKQLEILMTFLSAAGEDYQHFTFSKQDLLKKSAAGAAALQGLLAKGVLVEEAVVVSRLGDHQPTREVAGLVLNQQQERALSEIRAGFAAARPVLLHGVTGSGKTEIYISLIRDTLALGKQVLYILPEIALTSQIIERLRSFFGNRVQVFHSRYTDNQKAELWNRILRFTGIDDDPFIFVGARSAIFLPLSNPGLIIVDEEHDHSFKQYDPAPRYQARDAAVMLAGMHQVPVILGSATPAIESYQNALTGKYHLVNLTERYGKSILPRVLISDLTDARKSKTLKSHYSGLLLDQIQQALDQKMQVILFQNRRGFSLRVVCDTCHWYPGCPHCDVSLTYHKAIHRLKCHYCGYQTQVPGTCAECGSHEIRTVGFGTEKVEEELSVFFPKASIRRMDYDTTRSRDAFQKIIDDFEKHTIDILIGTQMVTKGLDFSRVAMVGILDADSMIAFPDFRSAERSFQHMVQVSGRAGRKDQQGTVVIQTWQPHHDLIRLAKNSDYRGFFNLVLSDRQRFGYPPFTRLVRIICKAKDPVFLGEASFLLAKELATHTGLHVMGPEYPPVARVKNQYIRHIMLKLVPGQNPARMKQIIARLVNNMQVSPAWRKVRLIIDVDPY
ncbi:MAG TPA: primosomal protein N' [Bacteroidales bacterium]|nr:primosomal protein N' [Bacteroidales bacterium]HRZ48321.1 primosomal protein N' [Bacteroidales bacterium]